MGTIMASTVSSGLQMVMNRIDSATNNPKLADLAKDTYNTEDTNTRITTDFGQKVGNTDHWLSVSTEDRHGPALLEDTHGREKVFSLSKAHLVQAVSSSLDPSIRPRAYSRTCCSCKRSWGIWYFQIV